MQRLRQVGLLGGSFDPLHGAHLALAKAALEAYALDEVRFLPCAQQALKGHQPAPQEDRCALLRLALANEPYLTLDCCELFRGGVTYTYDTLTLLRSREPQTHFWFIIGMDSVVTFPRWKYADKLLELADFIVFDRPGVDIPQEGIDPRLLAHRLKGPCMDISSSQLRRQLAENPQFRYPMGELTERYLRDHNLYM